MNARSTAVLVLPWLLCLLLVGLPRSGWAAPDVPLTASTGSLSLLAEEPRKETGPMPGTQPERYRAPWGLRLLAEVSAGALTSVAGGLVGSGLGWGTCLLVGIGREAPVLCVLAALVGGVLGLTEGYALGVWWGGELAGGDGSLLKTMLGATSALALASAAALVYVTLQGSKAYPEHASYPAFIIPLPVMLGAHLGYELFQRAPVASLQPTVALSSRGATLGLSGRF